MADLDTSAFLASLASAAATLTAQAERDLKRLGRETADDAQRRAPVNTGRLRDSIRTQDTDDGIQIHVEADYAGFVEYGTSDTEPQPFLRPSLAKARHNAPSAFKRL